MIEIMQGIADNHLLIIAAMIVLFVILFIEFQIIDSENIKLAQKNYTLTVKLYDASADSVIDDFNNKG